MGVLEELTDALARDTIAAAEELGDEKLIRDVAAVLGAASPTTEEAFMTAVRFRLAALRGRRYLEERIAQAQAKAPAPD